MFKGLNSNLNTKVHRYSSAKSEKLIFYKVLQNDLIQIYRYFNFTPHNPTISETRLSLKNTKLRRKKKQILDLDRATIQGKNGPKTF